MQSIYSSEEILLGGNKPAVMSPTINMLRFVPYVIPLKVPRCTASFLCRSFCDSAQLTGATKAVTDVQYTPESLTFVIKDCLDG